MVLLLVPETAVLFKKAKTSSETNLRNIDSKFVVSAVANVSAVDTSRSGSAAKNVYRKFIIQTCVCS